MDIRNLETFLKVVELGSFTKAAAELAYVQSTVTAHIQQMEQELGFPLFDRVGKKVYLTAGGQQLIPYARDALRIMEQISSLDQRPEKMKGILRIGVLESLMFSAMLNVLPMYQSRYKNIEIRIQTGSSRDLIEMLKKNQLDLIYISEVLNVDPELESCYKRRERMIFVASPGHKLANTGILSLHDILNDPLIITEKRGVVYRKLEELAARYRCSFYASFTVNSVKAIIEMLMRNLGMAFLPEYAVREYISDGRLIEIYADIPPQTYYSQVLYYRHKWIPPYMQGLIDTIRDNLPERM